MRNCDQVKFRNTSDCYGYGDKSTHYIFCVGVFPVKSTIGNEVYIFIYVRYCLSRSGNCILRFVAPRESVRCKLSSENDYIKTACVTAWNVTRFVGRLVPRYYLPSHCNLQARVTKINSCRLISCPSLMTFVSSAPELRQAGIQPICSHLCITASSLSARTICH